ncbi:MAG TPA: glycerophosphodiester phosphodiesterase [Ktedonobacterales bacterium]|jgi:glycerophosphoryl diester phosphodiesterase
MPAPRRQRSIDPIDIPRLPFVTHERPLFFAHRGGAALAPENTLPAYENGLRYGADALELDIHYTRDGEIVVFHDDMLGRTTDGSGRLAALTLDELRRLDAGYRFTTDGGQSYPWRDKGVTIPTLREVFQRFPQTRINIEMKVNDAEGERRLARLLLDNGWGDRALVGSFHTDALQRFRALCEGHIATSASASETRNFLLGVLVRQTQRMRPTYDALQVPEVYRGIRVVSPTSIRLAHGLGLDVHVWTVDDREAMERLLDWGVDGLMSDRPDTLAEVYRARGWLAAPPPERNT